MPDPSRLIDAVEAAIARIGRACGWLLLPLMAIIVVDVVGRRLYATGSVALQEMEWHLHAIVLLFAAAYAYQQGAHVRIGLVHERLSARARRWIEIVGCLAFLLPFTAILVYFGVPFWHYAWQIGEISAAPGGLPHRWIIKATLPLAFALWFVQGCATLARNLLALSRDHDRDAPR